MRVPEAAASDILIWPMKAMEMLDVNINREEHGT